jgi:hypothetical protein
LNELFLASLVPTASLFAAFGRHNSHLACVTLFDSEDTLNFTTRLSGGACLIKTARGTWEKSTSYYAASLL